MTTMGWVQIGVYLVALLALVKPLGSFMARVYQGERTFLDPVARPLERLVYRLGGVRPEEEMDWKTYAVAMLLFNALGLLALYVLQRVQGALPLNPQGLGAVSPDSSPATPTGRATAARRP
jgi:K+-transporting ATPase ATPase A chain